MALDGALDLTYGMDLDLTGKPVAAAGTTATTTGGAAVTTGVTTVSTAGNTTQAVATSNRLSPNTAAAGGAVPKVQGSSPGGKPLTPPKLTSLPQRPGSSVKIAQQQPPQQPDPNAPPPDYNSIVEKAGLPLADSAGGTDVAQCPGKDLKVKRRNMGLGMRPRIIIFSDKKDLIRVSLDTEDESDNEICNLSFKKPSSKFLGIKSARRRSIAGESFTLSSSMESLSDEPKMMKDERSASKDNLILLGYDGIPGIDGAINYAFDPEEFAAIESAEAEQAGLANVEEKPNENQQQIFQSKKSSPEIKKDSSKSESQTDEEQQPPEKPRSTTRPKSAKPKSAGKTRASHSGNNKESTTTSPKRVKVATRDSIPEQVDEEVDPRPSSKEAFEKQPSSSKEKSSRSGRSKSAKNGHNKVEPRSKGAGAADGGSKGKGKSSNKKDKRKAEDEEDEGASSSSPSRTRPLTALDRWSNKDVENMSKIVAWDRPEDDI